MTSPAPLIGSVNIYQVGQTCLLVPKIPPRSLATYVAGGPTAFCHLGEQEDTAIEATAREMLMRSRQTSETRGPGYDKTLAKQAFDDLMLGFGQRLGLTLPKLAKAVSLVFVTCAGDMAQLNRAIRRGKFAFEGVNGSDIAVDLATTPGFDGALARILRAGATAG